MEEEEEGEQEEGKTGSWPGSEIDSKRGIRYESIDRLTERLSRSCSSLNLKYFHSFLLD